MCGKIDEGCIKFGDGEIKLSKFNCVLGVWKKRLLDILHVYYCKFDYLYSEVMYLCLSM